MVEQMTERYAELVVESEAQLQLIRVGGQYCEPNMAAMNVLSSFRWGNHELPAFIEMWALQEEHEQHRCMYWLEAHYMLQAYKRVLPEELWDLFLDKLSWFPGVAIERVRLDRERAWERRRHLVTFFG